MPSCRLKVTALATTVALCGCVPTRTGTQGRPVAPEPPPLLAKLDHSLALAAQFLLSKQSPDGGWRSEVYGIFRDGPSLTPSVLTALNYLPDQNVPNAFARGADYLAGLFQKNGELRDDVALAFPVYAAGAGCWLAKLDPSVERRDRLQVAWLKIIREHRLSPELGWRPEDIQFGGWGYATVSPRKSDGGDLGGEFESNLSATLFGLGGWRAAGMPADDPLLKEALLLVTRCQNFSELLDQSDERFDDGGFFFAPRDPARSKAGLAGTDRFGRSRIRSYGSMTADGARALLQCGLPREDPRVAAARRWLEWNFSARTNPGRFAADREVLRDSYYYYWCWSAAHAFRCLKLIEINNRTGRVNWAEELARELISRQQPDGSWANRYRDAKEDDPLVATPMAAAALTICRRVLFEPDRDAGETPHPFRWQRD